VRNIDTLSKFKKAIRSSILMSIQRHHSYGHRKLNILLAQLRCNASFLSYDLCKVQIVSNTSCNCGAPCENSTSCNCGAPCENSTSCNCGAPCENSHHFFCDCDKYTDNREILFDSLNWLPSSINIDVKLLTKGSDFLTYQENTTIFKLAFNILKTPKDLQLSK
jgi:hypothetical protein